MSSRCRARRRSARLKKDNAPDVAWFYISLRERPRRTQVSRGLSARGRLEQTATSLAASRPPSRPGGVEGGEAGGQIATDGCQTRQARASTTRRGNATAMLPPWQVKWEQAALSALALFGACLGAPPPRSARNDNVNKCQLIARRFRVV